MSRTPGAALAAAFAAVVLLSACNTDGGGGPSWTAAPQTGASAQPKGTGTANPSAGATEASPSGTAAASAPATAAVWKTYTDAARKVRFDLPENWIAQAVTPDEGTLPGALKVEVKASDGTLMATLKTGLPDVPAADCPADQRKPYVVLSSVPVELPSHEAAAIAPHVVFRVIQGYKYFGSYGITNAVGGADGMACSLGNVVRGPDGVGNYSFSDLGALKAFAPDEKVAPAKAFDTLEQAGKYVSQGSEFANVQRMLMSLMINT
ncbi:hypothetical protein V1639_06860 [Pseudarthrobacter sp. J75]|uniref:hypothetical protein n=1 Tax=unclassified Pseudarthrobacter TaxID=2647000 RepID=UPI002E81ADEA|nr:MULTISPECIES: hypothetical protein [unclassified Pseudarthrobacter]MEE2521518.1 hypothetical protein [Pseudarthrobacter sp. J47]MEE2528750.1 hypothetical protein [Pseudarthrobacter sp. J75]